MMQNKYLSLLSICLIGCLIAGCGTRQLPGPSLEEIEWQIYELIDIGEYTAAATAYLKLAKNNPNRSNYYTLQAANAYFQVAELELTQQLLNKIPADIKELADQKNLLYAKLMLQLDAPATAIKYLQAKPQTETSQNFLVEWYTLLADSCHATQNYPEAVQAHQVLAGLLEVTHTQEENYKSLWKNIDAMDVKTLDSLVVTANLELQNWYQLGLLYKNLYYQTKVLQDAIKSWQEQHPNHPAQNILPSLLQATRDATQIPQHIALLLPLYGKYLKTSEAIQDGFLAAWYDSPQRPTISIYNTADEDILDIYRETWGNHVDFIVGPLQKENIQRIVEQNELDVPTLALNYIESDTIQHKNLFQFGLSPENEAEETAKRAWFDKHARALAITPQSEWGKRTYNAFKKQWESQGNKILEHLWFDPKITDYGTLVRNILNLDKNKQRVQKLERTIGLKLISKARIRQDADMIFIAAQSQSIMQIIPQLKFYGAKGIPVYTTSHIYSMTTEKTTDMNGVRFVDMPWVLEIRRELSILHSQLDNLRSIKRSNYRRLYALGIDAYHLIPRLNKLEKEKHSIFNGETGDLSVKNKKIKRSLVWGIFIDGMPVVEK